MRRSISVLSLFLTSLTLASFASAQSVTTIPVGFTTTAVTPAANASTPASSVVAVPFYQPANFVGAVSSVDSTTQLSISGAAFTPSPAAGDLVTVPHLARMKSGASVGRFFKITANTATQVSLDTATAGYTLTTGAPNTTQAQVVAGDSVEILPANTLGSLFGMGTVPFVTSTDPNAADNIFLFNGSSYDLYFHNGTNWRKSGFLTNQNNTVVLPDRGIFILRRGTTPLNLTFLGTVPSTTERTDFPGAGSSFKANRFPVDLTLGGATATAMNLQNLPNWIKSTDPNAADNVYLWNGTGWDLYFHNGTNWRKSGFLTNQDSKVVSLGTPIFVVRKSTAVGSDSTLVQILPYSLL